MRLIDADNMKSDYFELLRVWDDNFVPFVMLKDVIKTINNAPTIDAIEVIRCKYCKHFPEGMAIGMCKRIPDKPILPVPYNHFCSYGERRKGDEDERNER